ncbi:uncharacterized protein LOC118435999 [Folsomia candida]|uniref:uncharacterized protein LOC118435999 n=1 Tax=Folsomia candida TaxID=158441 RepID=UPI001604C265|nr:uncharacterized protein LOC118435999 [Folsomia candida]
MENNNLRRSGRNVKKTADYGADGVDERETNVDADFEMKEDGAGSDSDGHVSDMDDDDSLQPKVNVEDKAELEEGEEEAFPEGVGGPRKWSNGAPYPGWQTELLESSFEDSQDLSKDELISLMTSTKLYAYQIRIWFNNHRQRKYGISLTGKQRHILEDFYFANKGRLPSALEKEDLMFRAELSKRQVENWYKKARMRGIIYHDGTAPQQPKVINPSRRVFSTEKGRILRRDIDPDDNILEFWQMYLVLWVNTLGNVVAVTVGYTSWDSATDAAFANWNNIVNGDKACSYRNEAKEKKWRPLIKEAIPLGLYASDEPAAKKLKWWLRLRLLAMGTFHPHECLTLLRDHAQYLEETLGHYFDLLPPPTQRWITMSKDGIARYLLNPTAIFPGIDDRLVLRHKCKEEFGIDPVEAVKRINVLERFRTGIMGFLARFPRFPTLGQ